MSAEAMVETGFNQAAALAASTSAAAQALVATAVGVLNEYQVTFPSEAPTIADAGLSQGSSFTNQLRPPGFPTIREPNFPADPSLGELSIIDAAFTATEPSLDLPGFSYRFPSDLPPFTNPIPDIDTTVVIPAAPDTSYPAKPLLTAIDTDLPIDDITVPPFLGIIPTYSNSFTDEFYAAFSTGQSLVPDSIGDAMALVDRMFPGLNANYAALSERINGILEGRTTALTDNYDSHYYEQLRSKIESERLKQLKALSDSSKASGWEMPGAARFAAERGIEAMSAQALNAAALEVFTKRTEWELKHLEFVMELASKMHEMGITFLTNMSNHSLEAFKAALAFADTAVKFAHQVYELIQKDFQIKLGVLDAEIKIFDTLLKGQLAKIETIKQKIEVEKLKSDVNKDLVAIYTAELNGEKIKADVYASRINALEAEIRARKLPLDVFLATVQAYEALSNAKRSEYALIEAQINGDRAKVDGELAKLRVYETQARVYETEVNAQAKVVDSQARRNEEILAVYKTLVDSQLSLVKTDAEQGRYSLDAFEATAKIFISENDIQLQNNKFRFDKTLESAKLELEQLREKYVIIFQELNLEMERVKALANINLSASQVEGSLASSALSAMNAIVSASVVE